MERETSFMTMREDLRDLTLNGRIGDFDHFELTEVIATPKGRPARNVLSVVVLGEDLRPADRLEKPEFMTPRIRVEGFKDWGFGVRRVRRPVGELDQALAELAATGKCTLSGEPLQVGALHPQPAMFAPADGSGKIAINSLLKNNFWAGSHVFRLADLQKRDFGPFFEDRRRIQELSDAVAKAVPISFAGLADFLGDVVIQVPVLNVVASVTTPRGSNQSQAEVIWRSPSQERPVNIVARMHWDKLLASAALGKDMAGNGPLAIDGQSLPVETEMWDAQSGALLAATGPTSTIRRIDLATHRIGHEPRLFIYPDATGTLIPGRVRMLTTTRTLVGEKATQDASFWLGRRQDLEERRRLEETREFVQYRPQPGSIAERTRALGDLRWLIEKHGSDGVDLWDPYLCAEDILQTLFWSDRHDAPLRALTDGRDPPRQHCTPQLASPPRPSFSDRQKSTLSQNCGNCEGLTLEYRTRHGPKGWAFHDRFLIFPNADAGPKVWAIGASINSVGNAHHILQRVSNPALIAGAFQDLWEALDEPQHVVWKSW